MQEQIFLFFKYCAPGAQYTLMPNFLHLYRVIYNVTYTYSTNQKLVINFVNLITET